MTREEAIQVLESMKSEENYNALIDLCNMAMESLQRDIERHEMVIQASERYLGVVRCKDCEYADFKCPYPVCNFIEMNITDNDFCSWGERREE